MDIIDTAIVLGGAAFGLLAFVYLVSLLAPVMRGVGLGLGEAIVKVLIITALGAVSWALLGIGGVL